MDVVIAAIFFFVPILCFVVAQESSAAMPGIARFEQTSARPYARNFRSGALPQPGVGQGQTFDGAGFLRNAQQQSSLPPMPPPALAAAGWPGPEDLVGTYLILKDTVPVSSGAALSSQVIGSLTVGEAVAVQEVIRAPDESEHLRGRLKYPVGWISLINLQDGVQFAVKRSQGPIVMHGLLDGSRVGLAMNQDLVVTRLVDPRAAEWGWCIGDRIREVSGIPVKGEADFMDEIQRAAVVWKTTGQPIAFDIVRGIPIDAGNKPETDRAREGVPTKAPLVTSHKKLSCF